MFLFPQPSAVGKEGSGALEELFLFSVGTGSWSSPSLTSLRYAVCVVWLLAAWRFWYAAHGISSVGPFWYVHRSCLCTMGTSMILHLAEVFCLAPFLCKIKLDPFGDFSKFKTCRRFFLLPVFSVLSYLAELSKYLICGRDEGVFQVSIRVLVLGGTRLEAAQSHCFPFILWAEMRHFSFCIRSYSGWLGN